MIYRASTSDVSFSSLLRFSRNSFERLIVFSDLEQLAWWDGFTDSSRTERAPGRPHMLDGPGHIALPLVYLSSKIDNRHLGTMFGLTNPMRDLRISLSFLLDTLKGIDESCCKVRPNQLQASAAAVEGQYGRWPLPGFHCCGAGDCFVSFTYNQGDAVTQNSFYNGKNGKPAVNNLTVIDFLGRTIFFSGNWRGKRHDSMIFQASGCEDFLRRVLPPGYYIYISGKNTVVVRSGDLQPALLVHGKHAFYGNEQDLVLTASAGIRRPAASRGEELWPLRGALRPAPAASRASASPTCSTRASASPTCSTRASASPTCSAKGVIERN